MFCCSLSDIISMNEFTVIVSLNNKSNLLHLGNGLVQALICFSILKNARTLINTKSPKDSIRSINGIRAISMTWVILGHVFFFSILTAPGTCWGFCFVFMIIIISIWLKASGIFLKDFLVKEC